MTNPNQTTGNNRTNPIKFGTDGWRGVIGDDFTFERLTMVAPLAATVLAENYTEQARQKNLILVGHDRRFMAEDFARSTAEALQAAGFDVLLAQSYAPTPALSWAAKAYGALGALVITASHNPGRYLGLKVKGSFGGSVTETITQQIEALVLNPPNLDRSPGTLTMFDPWESYTQGLQQKVNIEAIRNGIIARKIRIFADVMHGAAATGLERLLGVEIEEINSDRDPLFGGGAPEPLPKYLGQLMERVESASLENPQQICVGFAFDGDSDRIAAVDRQGNFLSSQVLIPILIEHLNQRKGFAGEIVKTVSGSDLIPRLAEFYQIPLFETPIGYKYIGDRMLQTQVLIGGEESGGVGYGSHIPERDALLSALYVLEAIMESGQDLGEMYSQLRSKVDFYSEYDRIDIPLPNMTVRGKLLERLQNNTPQTVAGKKVIDCLAIDGYKLRLEDNSWLLIRFSGTEPVLRLYCEGSNTEAVQETLNWARDWANSI